MYISTTILYFSIIIIIMFQRAKAYLPLAAAIESLSNLPAKTKETGLCVCHVFLLALLTADLRRPTPL